MPDRSLPPGHPHLHSVRLQVDLTPKSVADPYANATPSIRQSSGASATEQNFDDSGIRFSDKLFEVPALRGVKVEAIATGGRNSFVKTESGRVLGWGANQFGCVHIERVDVDEPVRLMVLLQSDWSGRQRHFTGHHGAY